MSVQFEHFMDDVKKNDFWVLFAQVRKDNEIIDDWGRFPYKMRFESYSACKTFAGVGVGIAIDEGLLSLDEKICDTFKRESYDVTNHYALDLTVRDLLTMSTGTDRPLFWRDSQERAHCKDWIRYFYEKGNFVRAPGEKFLYNNVNPYLLGCLIERKTGQNLHEYLRYRLFEPLDIPNPDWTICPMGHTVAANGMAINVDELGRFGQMLLDGGVFKGKRIVSEAFVREMMSSHIQSDEVVPTSPKVPMDYGYQIWVDPVNHCAFPWGSMGQYCIVMPEKGIVITVLSLQDGDGGSNGNYAPSPLRRAIWENLVTQY